MTSTGKTPQVLPPGIWQDLLRHAYTLIDEIARHGIRDPVWTFGGGTVLMLRHAHRLSKDIDIFVPDPQYLGFVPDGHPKLLHLWPVKLLQAGRTDYEGSAVMAMRAAASLSR